MENAQNKYSTATKVGIILTTGLLGSLAIGYAPILENAGMAMLLVRWIPLVLGAVGVFIYFIVKAFAPLYSNMVSWVLVLLIVLYVIRVFMTDAG